MSQRMVRPGMRPQVRTSSTLRPLAKPLASPRVRQVSRAPTRSQVPLTPAAPKKPLSPLENVLAFRRGPGGATSCTNSSNEDNWKINTRLPLTVDNICQTKKECLEQAYKDQGPMACYNPDGSKKDKFSFENCLKAVCNKCIKVPCATGGKRKSRKSKKGRKNHKKTHKKQYSRRHRK